MTLPTIDGIPILTSRSVAVPRLMFQLIDDHDYRCPCLHADWYPFTDSAVMRPSDPPSEAELDLWVLEGEGCLQ